MGRIGKLWNRLPREGWSRHPWVGSSLRTWLMVHEDMIGGWGHDCIWWSWRSAPTLTIAQLCIKTPVSVEKSSSHSHLFFTSGVPCSQILQGLTLAQRAPGSSGWCLFQSPWDFSLLAFSPLPVLPALGFLLMSQVRACLWCLCGAVSRRSLLHQCSSFKTFHFRISFNSSHKALITLVEFSATCLGNKTCRCLGNREMMLVTSNYFKTTGKYILKNRKEWKKRNITFSGRSLYKYPGINLYFSRFNGCGRKSYYIA